MEKVKCFGNRIEEPFMKKGKPCCTATHPDKPNYSGHSRGRKIHLAKNKTHTVCNMLIDEYVPKSSQNWSMFHNGYCKNCFK